ncbi:MAG: BON domain-containing protein, partial [Rickettsiales bacterium]
NEVINEINIAEPTNKLAIKDYSIDSWITTQIKARLLINKYIRSVNYNIETVDKTVYLFGIAQNDEESKSVSSIASTTKYVKHVISHVKL